MTVGGGSWERAHECLWFAFLPLHPLRFTDSPPIAAGTEAAGGQHLLPPWRRKSKARGYLCLASTTPLSPLAPSCFSSRLLSGEEGMVWTAGYHGSWETHVADPLLCVLDPPHGHPAELRLSCLDRCTTVRRYFMLMTLTLKNGKSGEFCANFTPINN